MNNKFINFHKIYKLKTNTLLKQILAFFYLRFTEYEIFVDSSSEPKILIFYAHEKIFRDDYHSFLLNLHQSLKSSSLIILKRKISLKYLFCLDNPIIKNLDMIYNMINIYKNIILFYPHSLSGSWLQERFMNKYTISLQHGYYQYPKKEFNIFSKATKTDVAIIFNKDYLNFFSNCNRCYVQNNYLKKQKFLAEIINCDACIYYSIITESNLKLNKKILDLIMGNKKNILIYHHPHTSIILKIKFHFYIIKKYKIRPRYLRKKYLTLDNFFVNTTIWKDFDLSKNVTFNIYDSTLKKFVNIRNKYLVETEHKNFFNLIKKIEYLIK